MKDLVNTALIAKNDTYVSALIEYSFSHCMTDTTKVFIPKGTRLFVNNVVDNDIAYCNIINNKDFIFNRLESDLRKKFPEFADESHICERLSITLHHSDTKNFITSKLTDDDLFDIYLR
jgi:hypothetical protein